MTDDPVLWCGKRGVVATCTINPPASEPVTVCMIDGEDIRKALRTLLRTHFGFDLPEVETLKVPAVEEWD